MDYRFDQSDLIPQDVPRRAPTTRNPRPPRSSSPFRVAPGPSMDSVLTVPIQHTADGATPAPTLLGAPPPEAPRRASTPPALPETPSPAEIEFLESAERYSHTDWAREQHAEPVCDAAIRYPLIGHPLVFPDDFFLHLAPHKLPPLSEVHSLAAKSRLYEDDDGIFLLVRKLTPHTPACPDKPGGRATHLLHDEPTRIYVPWRMRTWVMHMCHDNASCYLGVARTLPMLDRFSGKLPRISARGGGFIAVYSASRELLPDRGCVGPSFLSSCRLALMSR